jgi:hypothetical protein
MRYSRLLPLFLLASSIVLVAQSNPVPLIYQPLKPAVAKPGQPAFALTVCGTGFVEGAVVQWNSTALETKFISARMLQAEVPAKDVAVAATASVTVANPGTIASNVIYFSVREPSSTVALKADPQSLEAGQIAVGDFSNNGLPDVALQAFDEDLDVYLNQGHESFEKIPGSVWGGIGVLPAPIDVVADFNGDGNLDVSVCYSLGTPSSGCLVYLGDGQGGMTSAPGTGVDGGGSVADVNGDGILDYITVVESGDGIGSTLLVNLGNGDGTFQTTNRIGLNNNKIGAVPVIADFNNDGILDVAVPVYAGYVAIFFGKGDGTFHQEVDVPVTNPGSLAVADVNGDGNLDIVTDGVSVLLGNGNGTFTAGSSFVLPNSGFGGNLVLADMNGDGILDLVTATMDSNYNQTVNVMLGNGNGTFQNPITFAQGEAWWDPTIGVADLNNDGRLDVVLDGQNAVSLLFQAPSN